MCLSFFAWTNFALTVRITATGFKQHFASPRTLRRPPCAAASFFARLFSSFNRHFCDFITYHFLFNFGFIGKFVC